MRLFQCYTEVAMLINPRKKRTYPPGTFISTTARAFSIAQLCLAFTLVCWNLSLPFMGEIFDYKSSTSLYHTVMGETKLLKPLEIEQSSDLYEKQMRNRNRFENLPHREQAEILNQYQQLKSGQKKSFFEKSIHGIEELLFKQPTFQMAWLCLAIIIPVILLLKVESARQAIWLLPLVACIYGIDNFVFAPDPKPGFDAQLFPSEQYIIDEYLEAPLSKNIFEQREQLKRGWELYLIDRWKSDIPSPDPARFKEQVEEAEYNFHMARLKLQTPPVTPNDRYRKEPLGLLLSFIGWNLLFATAVHRSLKKNKLERLTQ